MVKIPKTAFSVFAIVFGIFFFVYGGFDDSPGAQAIGLAVAAIGASGFVKRAKANIKKHHD
jgi:predicted permease